MTKLDKDLTRGKERKGKENERETSSKEPNTPSYPQHIPKTRSVLSISVSIFSHLPFPPPTDAIIANSAKNKVERIHGVTFPSILNDLSDEINTQMLLNNRWNLLFIHDIRLLLVLRLELEVEAYVSSMCAFSLSSCSGSEEVECRRLYVH